MKKEQLRQKVAQYQDYALRILRHLVENPELSWHEYQTCAYLQQQLDSFQIPNRRICETGIVATIGGKNPDSRTVFVRADLDALPISCIGEKWAKSKVPGVSHACGHALHATCALITALILNDEKSKLEGTAVIIFQPAEEVQIPRSGAMALIEAGVLDYPNPIAMFGLHATPSQPLGTVCLRAGPFMAGCASVKIRLAGQKGHISQPHNNVNVIPAAAELVKSLETIATQYANPAVPTLVAFSSIHSAASDGNTTNIAPDLAELVCVYRTLSPTFLLEMKNLIEKISQNVASNYGAKVESFLHTPALPPVVNDPNLTAWAREQLLRLFEKDQLGEAALRLGGDDIAYYFEKIPGLYLRLGTGNPVLKTDIELHQEGFQVDPGAMPAGISALSWLTFQALKKA